MKKLKKATQLLLGGSSAVINGRHTTSVRDVIDCFQDGWENQVIRRQLLVDGSGTYLLLALGFISKGRQLLVGGMSLPSVLDMLDEDLEVIKTDHDFLDVLSHIAREDILEPLRKYYDRHIVVDDKSETRDDFIVADSGYRVMYRSEKGENKKDAPVLVREMITDFTEVENYFGGIVCTSHIEGEAKFVLEQMEITLVLTDTDELHDLHRLFNCDANGKGVASCEVHFDYVTLQGDGDLPLIPEGKNSYVEAYRAIRRNGKEGCVFVYVGGVNSYDKANRVREYRQCLFNLKHREHGTTHGNGLGIRPTNVIHESGVNNLLTGRVGGVDSYWLVQECIKKAKSVSKEILSVSAIVN